MRLLHKSRAVRGGQDHSVMAQNFLSCNREQSMLLPASVAEWLPEGHLARFVVTVVERLDLAAFYAAYRADGSGRAARDPQ